MVEPGPGPSSSGELGDRPGRRRRRDRLAAIAEAERTIPVTAAIVGVQKAATGTLYGLLTSHPEVARGPQKEMRFFLRDKVDWDHPSYHRYVRPADDDRERLACDATPAYLIFPEALPRMHRYDPAMRLMATFRDPIERAISQWSMQRERDPDFPDLPDTVARWASATIPVEIPAGMHRSEFGKVTLYARGLYGQQLRRGMSIFPAEQWLCLDFRDVVGEHAATADRVLEFLGLAPFETPPRLPHWNATTRGLADRPLSVADVGRLVDLYAPDLEEFATLSGVDVAGWPTARVAAGDLAVADFAAKLEAKVRGA
ncbi:MAG: sulfotransferase [Nocardioides sp.]